MSRATSLVSVAQQLSIAAGVAVGALAVELAVQFEGRRLITAEDFRPAFLLVGAIAASSALLFWSLPPDAGASLANREPIAAPDASDQRASRRSELTAAKPGRQQIKLGRIRAARLRLDVLHAREVALEAGEQRASVPPCSTLVRKLPPGRSTSRANSAAASTSAMILSWSVFLWPVAFAAMSESTTSAPPPSISCSTRGRVGVEEIDLAERRRPATGVHVEMSIADDLAAALRGADPRCAATSLQPPGAAPRSTTRAPGLSRRYLSSISISL